MIDYKFSKIVKNDRHCHWAQAEEAAVTVRIGLPPGLRKGNTAPSTKAFVYLNIIGPIPSVVLQLSIFLLLENKSLRPSVYI
jgi:hypothetical protein